MGGFYSSPSLRYPARDGSTIVVTRLPPQVTEEFLSSFGGQLYRAHSWISLDKKTATKISLQTDKLTKADRCI